jgi:hypothetical protein
LLGIHSECHKFLPSWRKHQRIDGRLAGNQMECATYKQRHDDIAAEMLRRGYSHQSPLEQPDFSYLPPSQQVFRVPAAGQADNRSRLAQRCPSCRLLMADS